MYFTAVCNTVDLDLCFHKGDFDQIPDNVFLPILFYLLCICVVKAACESISGKVQKGKGKSTN